MPGFARGALFVRDSVGTVYRLSWNEDDAAVKETSNESADAAKSEQDVKRAPDRRRALPPGRYTMLGYRLNRTDEHGERWDLSATKPGMRKLTIESDEVLELELDERITLRHRLTHKRFSVNVIGDHGVGLTIYRAGKRIPIDFALQDQDGKQRFEGRIRYG